MFKCSNCQREFSSKQSLQRHESRKVSCLQKADKIYKCNSCDKIFHFASNRSNHYKVCREKTNDKITESDLPELLKLINDLKLTKEEVKKRLSGNNNNTTNITNINNIQIIITNFGKEDISRIAPSILHQCMGDTKKGIQMLTKHIHFNDDFPNDKNIRKGSTTNKTLQIMEGGAWTHANKNTVLDKVIVDKARIINGYMNAHYWEIDRITRELFEIWYRKVTEKRGEEFFNIRNELFILASSI